jgi:hypothetical protein
VLPVVSYTGTRRWESPGRLVDLVDLAEHFENMIPAFELEMRRKIADELEEKGALKNRRQVLLRLLKQRFRNVPAAVSAIIQATHDPEQLLG